LIVRETVVTKGVLAEAEALVLVSSGVEAAARLVGVSGRTIRRRCEVAGVSVSVLVHRVRLDATSRVFRIPVPTSVVARWLGFTNPDAYRRFVRREMGVSVKQLRRRVRESAVFLVQGGRCASPASLFCSKIEPLNAGVEASIDEKAARRQGQ
jgi:AraC-like DNA-binding protein